MVIKQYLRKNVIARRMATCCRKIIYLKSNDFRLLKESKGKRRLIYLSEIDHGNLGDHAINYATKEFLKPYESEFNKKIFINRKYCLASIREIGKETSDRDVIVVPGGGWIGTLWRESGELFIKILECCSESKIIVFPQTITFEKTEYGQQQERDLYVAIQKCRSLLLMVRDQKSYNFLKEKMPKESGNVQYLLAPDIALSIDPNLHYQRNNTIGFCFRQDKEKVVSEALLLEIKRELMQQGNEVINFDTVMKEHINPKERENGLFKLWTDIAKMKLVITDRLHGMIFAAITNTACIALNNSNGKVVAVYELWLSWNKNIRILDISEVNWKEDFHQMLATVGNNDDCDNLTKNNELNISFQIMHDKVRNFL